MLAIPVFRARVAPVLDWCSKIVIFSEEGSDTISGQQIDVVKENVYKLMRTLREQGIKTLICGALSAEMLNYGESIGLRIIHGIAGEIEEVLQAYHEDRLDQPRYWLPGRRGQQRYKGGAKCTGKGKRVTAGGAEPAGPGQGGSRDSLGLSRGDKETGGLEGIFVCSECGSEVRHKRGIPCSQVRCAKCSSSMTRE